MTSENISDRVKEFIFKYIDSIEQLEVLFILRADPTKAWNANQLSDELRSNPASIRNRIRLLQSSTLGELKGLQVFHLVFGAGSDEEQHDLHVVLSFDQNNRTGGLTTRLVSVFETVNEGPNNDSHVWNRPNAKLQKLNDKIGEFEPITDSAK